MRNHIMRGIGAALAAAVIAVLATILLTVIGSSDADLSYRSLDYDVQVLDDGDLRITQRIDMRLKDRSDDDGENPWKQLYQQYTLKANNLTAISDVSVTNVTTGEQYTQIDPRSPSGVSETIWNTMYAGHWYLADVSGGADNPQRYDADAELSGDKAVELGWNIPFTTEADSLEFEVSMTFEGVSTAYDDLVTFQWEPFGKKNMTPIGELTGTLRFPEGAGADDSLAWLHYTGVSSTSRGDDGSLHFTASDVRAGQYLDVVAGFDAAAAPATVRRGEGTIRQTLLDDESQQEREWRDGQRTGARITLALWIAFAVAIVALGVWGVTEALRSVRRSGYHGDLDYWREPPSISPASAARMIDVAGGASHGSLGDRQMTATILSLASKQAIRILPGPARIYHGVDVSRAGSASLAAMIGSDAARLNDMEDTSTLVIMPVSLTNRASLSLSQSESAAMTLLMEISERAGSPVFDFERMQQVCERWEDGHETLERFSTSCATEFALLDATRTIGARAVVAGTTALLVGVGAMIYNFVIGNIAMMLVEGGVGVAVGAFILGCTAHTALSEPDGRRYAGEVLGLKRYMEDFSDFADRGAADLTLWDRYLVYAAAFGMSERVAKELAKAYPQLRDPEWLDSYASGSLLYWSYRPYGWYAWRHHGTVAGGTGAPPVDPSSFSANFGDLGAQISAGFSALSSTIEAAAPSSSSSGGSFSGGGFGGSSGGSGGGSFGGR